MHFFQLRFSLGRKLRDANRFVSVYGLNNMTIDFCRYLRGIKSSKFMNMIFKDLESHTNIVHSCPFSVNSMDKIHNQMQTFICQCSFLLQDNIYLRNFPIDTSLPFFHLPDDNYRIQQIVTTRVGNKERIFIKLALHITVTENEPKENM